jgi:hypothetical protein
MEMEIVTGRGKAVGRAVVPGPQATRRVQAMDKPAATPAATDGSAATASTKIVPASDAACSPGVA